MGHLLCPNHTRDGCMVAVWSTPKHPENHAKAIRRAVARCPACRDGVTSRGTAAAFAGMNGWRGDPGTVTPVLLGRPVTRSCPGA